MDITIDELKGKITINSEDYYCATYYLSGNLMNVRFFREKQGKFIELYPNSVDQELGRKLIVAINQVDKINLLGEEEEERVTERIKALDRLVQLTMASMPKDRLLPVYFGEFAGKQYVVSKTKRIKVKDLFHIYRDNEGTFDVTIMDSKLAEYACLDYFKQKEVRNADFIKVSPLTFIGFIPMGIKEKNCFSFGVFELTENGIKCNKAYGLKRKDGALEILEFEKYTQEVYSALESDVRLLTTLILKNMA